MPHKPRVPFFFFSGTFHGAGVSVMLEGYDAAGREGIRSDKRSEATEDYYLCHRFRFAGAFSGLVVSILAGRARGESFF
jgi:hypothetical protein